MAQKNPVEVAARWAARLGASTEAIKSGVNAVTVSPGESAARQIPAYLAGVQAAVADGRVERGLRSFTLADWKQAVLEKGLSRITQGAQAAKPKMEAFMGKFLPHVEAGRRALESMPRGDIETNIQRAVAMMRHNASFRR